MSRPIDLARHFLALADRDIRAFRKLVDDPEIDEATVGFLAQQAIEKSLKATLALYNCAFRRTHDLAELLDILAEAARPEKIILFGSYARGEAREDSEGNNLKGLLALKAVDMEILVQGEDPFHADRLT